MGVFVNGIASANMGFFWRSQLTIRDVQPVYYLSVLQVNRQRKFFNQRDWALIPSAGENDLISNPSFHRNEQLNMSPWHCRSTSMHYDACGNMLSTFEFDYRVICASCYVKLFSAASIIKNRRRITQYVIATGPLQNVKSPESTATGGLCWALGQLAWTKHTAPPSLREL